MDSYFGKSLTSHVKDKVLIGANEKRKYTFAEGDLVQISPTSKRPETGWLARKGEVGVVNKIITLDNKKMVYVKFPRYMIHMTVENFVHIEDIDRENLLVQANLANAANRIDDCLGYVESLCVPQGYDFNREERRIYSIAYKKVFNGYRKSLKQLLSTAELSLAQRNSDIGKKKTYANFVFNKVEEFSIMVEEAIFLIEKVLLPNCHRTHNTVNIVFFYKCKGDFLRYLLHFKSGEPKNKLIRRSDKAYVYGYRIAQKGEMGLAEPLIPSHPMRLAISLNYSVYLYTVKKERRRAAGHCKQAFDAAVAWVDRLSEDNYADATHLMKQMRDNLNNWLGQDLSSLITFSITGN